MAREPLVSVIIDNYNYAAFLRDAVDSALAQGWSRSEVIVVDDGSTDGSRAILETYGDRIRTVYQANAGQAAAFNAGVAAANGEVLCFLDSDDVWLPHKVERCVAALEAHPATGWLRHRLAVVDADLSAHGAALPRFRGTRVRTPRPLAFIEGCYPVLTSGLVLRRAVAERVFPLPLVTAAPPGMPGTELVRDADAYVAFSAAATGAPFLSLDEALGLYRRHAHQRWLSDGDVAPILHRQIALGAGVSSAFTPRLGRHVVPTSVYKHRAVLAALAGRSLLSAERRRPALEGAFRTLPLLAVSPRLFARQAAALAFGTFAPRLWVKKLAWHQGFDAAEGASDDA